MRIKQINKKLAELPAAGELYSWAEARTIERRRRSLLDDIQHNERLIAIAERGTD